MKYWRGYSFNSSTSALASFKVGGVEAFGEPAVDLGEHRALRHDHVLSEWPCEAEVPGPLTEADQQMTKDSGLTRERDLAP